MGDGEREQPLSQAGKRMESPGEDKGDLGTPVKAREDGDRGEARQHKGWKWGEGEQTGVLVGAGVGSEGKEGGFPSRTLHLNAKGNSHPSSWDKEADGQAPLQWVQPS